jgi:hypothetical protein
MQKSMHGRVPNWISAVETNRKHQVLDLSKRFKTRASSSMNEDCVNFALLFLNKEWPFGWVLSFVIV